MILCAAPAVVFAQGKAKCYTTWDDNYFYAAFHIDDPDITGTNAAPFSNPWEDDSVEVFLETDNKHNPGRSPATFSMAVSSAGGATFTQGNSEGKWQSKQIISFKYATIADGSLNNPEDLDLGYVVELAIPWFEMGVQPPTPGTMMSFNIIIRMKGDANGFVSLSPQVKTEQDIQDASKWVNIVFANSSFGVATLSLDKIVSARYVARMPLIDGQIRQKEYNNNTSFDIPIPMQGPSKPRSQVQKMLLTYYFYWYQGDPRKAAPFGHVRSQDGTSELTDKPVKGAGPWFSYDRVQWHKEELTDNKRADVDIILPVYWGDPVNRARFAAKGLDCMVESIRELRAEKKPYPLVGMFFDTTAMQSSYGDKPEARDPEEVKRTFYGMIKDFFSRIPDDLRAQVQMMDERSAHPCYIIDLYTSSYVAGFDQSFISYVNERFLKDFNANLLWIGSTDYKDKCGGLDGYCNYGAGLESGYDDTARIRIASVGAGYDDTAVPGRRTPIRARDDGDGYKTDWGKILDKRPNWIMVDGWNEFHEGSDICGSREYGFAYVDTTALQALKFRGARDYDAKYLSHNLPETILPGTFYQVDLTIQNDGIKPWKAAEGYALGYRWFQDGVPVGESIIKRPLQQDILPGHSSHVTIGVAAITEKNEPLPDGSYEIRFEMVRMSDNKWFSALGDEGFYVPIKVGKPEARRTGYLVVDGPVMMRTGTDYRYKVAVRNDGAETWKAGVASVGCRLYRVASYLHNGPSDMDEEVAVTPIAVPLAKDVAPGEVADVELTVNLKDPSGNPIPVWKQSDQWSYQLRFDVQDGGRWLSEAGARTCNRIVDIFENDYGADIVAADVPDVLDAGKTCDVKLAVRNVGPDTWAAGSVAFGYHWYYLDGTEAVWDGLKTPIKEDIKPGVPAIITTKLKVPEYDGHYILAWDMAVGDRWASVSEISHGGDLLTTEVTVQNGKLVFTDLSKLFDIVAVSSDMNRKGGDFDGSGNSFPAEMFPPDTGTGKPNDIYPCGYYWKAVGEGIESSRKISFKLGPDGVDTKNAVKCSGQTVAVPRGSYVKVHVLGAAVEPDQVAEFGLGYQKVEPVKVTMSSWLEDPAHGEDAAFVTLHRHYAAGDERGKRCSLFHYVIPVDPSRPLTSIVLPNNDRVRVVAITLER